MFGRQAELISSFIMKRPLKWDDLRAAAGLIGAVYFMFRIACPTPEPYFFPVFTPLHCCR